MRETNQGSVDNRKASSASPLLKKIDSEEFSDNYDTRKLYLGTWRHLLLIIMCMVLLAAVGYWASRKLQTTYEAESIVLYQDQREASKHLEGGFSLTNLTLTTVLDVIKAPKNLQAVKTRLGLDSEVEAIDSMIKIPTPRSESNLIKIIVRGDNPNLVVDIANSLANVAVRESQEYTRLQLRAALDNYRTQLGTAQRALAIQLANIEAFKNTNQYYAMDPEAVNILEQVENARNSRNTADLEYSSLLVQYENLKEELEKLPEYVPINRESQNSPLQMRVISLETQLAEASARYTKDNPKVLQIERELNDLMRTSRGEKTDETERFYERSALKDRLALELLHLQGKVLSAKKVKDELNSRLKTMEEQLQSLPVKQMELVRLLQAKESTEEQIQFLSRAVETTQLMVNLPKGSIELYQTASKASPWKEGLWVDLLPLVFALIGLGLGVTCAVLIEMADKKLRTPHQIGMYYSVPCLIEVPELPMLTQKNVESRLLFFTRQIAELIDRTTVKKSEASTRVVNFTSSLNGEGKTTLGYLQASYRAGLGQNVLFVEFDWRKNPWNPFQGEKCLLDYLEGNASFDEVIAKEPFPRTAIKRHHPGIKELLKSQNMHRFWKEASERYALILTDSPGMIQENYAVNVAEQADQTFFVVGSSQANKRSVDAALNILERAGIRPESMILNRVRPIYIDDARIKLEMKRSNRQLLRRLLPGRNLNQ
jgi:capsular polysaccharide biosynthesis protein